MSVDVSSPPVKSVRWRDRLSRLWQLRARYSRFRSWLLSIYNRALVRTEGLPLLPGRQRIVTVHLKGIPSPFYVRLGTTDWYVLEEIFFDGVYDPLISRTRGEVRQIIDLGANTGFSTRLWRMTFPGARVIAVEPDASNIKMCRRNLSVKDDKEHLQLVEACVSGKERRVALDRSQGSWRFSMTEARKEEEEGLIDARTLPQIMDECGMQGKIDFIKCNIEGAEAEVFAHCAEWIGLVGLLAVQVHHPYTSEQLLEDLKRAGSSLKLYHSMDCEAGSKLLFLEEA